MRWVKNMLLLVTLTAVLSCTGSSIDVVKVLPQPQQIYIEQGASGQYLNFDFLVENSTDKTLRLSKIVVSVFDGKNRLLLQRFLDSNGFSPSIQIIPDREVGPQQSLLIFNPFSVFASGMELGRLRFEFTFDPTTQGKQYIVEAIITPVNFQPKTDLILPLKGRLLIFDGHDFYAHHRRLNYLHPVPRQLGVNSNFMRYAEDFSMINEAGEKFKGNEDNLDNWFAFGAPVYAAGDGKIAAASDDLPDTRTFNDAGLASGPMMLYGNYIVIDHLNGEFSIFGHLKQGSSKVKVGEMVKQGQQIAQIGSSGSAYFPHLHYELRTGIDLKAEGLPSYFRDFRRILGERVIEVKKGPVETGEIVERQ